MNNFILIVFLLGWLIYAIWQIRHHRTGCDGNCADCHHGSHLCEEYHRDNPKKY